MSYLDTADELNTGPTTEIQPKSVCDWPLTVRLRKADLQDAFPIVEPCAGKRILFRLSRKQVTLRAEQTAKTSSKSQSPALVLWSETVVPLMKEVAIEDGIDLEFEIETDLFTDYLCRRDLHGMTADQRKHNPDEHFSIRFDRSGTGPRIEAGPVRIRIVDADFSIRCPGRFNGAAPNVPRIVDGPTVSTRSISDAFGMLNGFMRSTKADTAAYAVTIRDRQVRFLRNGLMRTVEDPSLEDLDMTLGHTQALQLGRILKHFGGVATLAASDNDYVFVSPNHACGVERSCKPIPVDPMRSLSKSHDVVSIDGSELDKAINIMLNQADSSPETLRFEVSGGVAGALRIPLSVEGGEAEITCSIMRPGGVEAGESPSPLRATVETQFLRALTPISSAPPTKLTFFPEWLVITEQRATVKIHTALAVRKRRP
jgi:hypothetical protein